MPRTPHGGGLSIPREYALTLLRHGHRANVLPLLMVYGLDRMWSGISSDDLENNTLPKHLKYFELWLS